MLTRAYMLWNAKEKLISLSIALRIPLFCFSVSTLCDFQMHNILLLTVATMMCLTEQGEAGNSHVTTTMAHVDFREQKGKVKGTAKGMRATVWLGREGQKEILHSKGGEE